MMLRVGLAALVCTFSAAPALAEEFLVKDQAQYFKAAKQVEAGDTITLANGTWRDFEMVISARGSAKKPIIVRAKTAGKVILSGQSNLRIGGKHVTVTGLVFRNGYSPTGEVISFRRSKEDLASFSRVTETVIDHFSKPDRFESDYWVGIYGQQNRFDHNHMSGKTNKGVTLAVRLDSKESQENKHLIDHNYFGPRPVLGSNGGETLRIGTSKYAMYNSDTVVANNYFDRCDGEVEIISSKSGRNVFRGNVFYESSGTLTLRHGDGNLVEGNVFFGNGKDHTGGIRVINRDQTVRNNYMEGLRGTGFASAITVMNGVPNSPVNRYVQVSGASITNNSVIDSAVITLAGGADAERSAAPIDSEMVGNLFTARGTGPKFVIHDDIGGIKITGNVLVGEKDDGHPRGITPVKTGLARAGNRLLYSDDPKYAEIGAPRSLKVLTREQTGVDWYPKPAAGDKFGVGKVIAVSPGEDSLTDALSAAAEGDRLMLTSGEYVVNKTMALSKTISIEGAQGSSARIVFARPSLIEIREGGNLRLANLAIDGVQAPDSVGNAVIRTTSYPMQSNFVIEMDGVSVSNLDVNKSFHVIALGKSAFADRVRISNSSFTNISGSVLLAAAETEDYGQYNVEYVDISGSTFTNIGNQAFNVYRGGRDESTFGPHFSISKSKFSNVGRGKNNVSGASILIHGVQYADIGTTKFLNSAPLKVVHTVGKPKTRITKNKFFGSPAPVLEEMNYDGAQRAQLTGNEIKGAKKP